MMSPAPPPPSNWGADGTWEGADAQTTEGNNYGGQVITWTTKGKQWISFWRTSLDPSEDARLGNGTSEKDKKK